MPRLSERGQLLADIDRLIRHMAVDLTSAQLLNPPLASDLTSRIDELMTLKFGILCYRNLNCRRLIMKGNYLFDVLPSLDDLEFIQDLRCSRRTFQAIVEILQGIMVIDHVFCECSLKLQMILCFTMNPEMNRPLFGFRSPLLWTLSLQMATLLVNNENGVSALPTERHIYSRAVSCRRC